MSADDPDKAPFFRAIDEMGAFQKKCIALHKRFRDVEAEAKPAFASCDAATLAKSGEALAALLKECKQALPGADVARKLIDEARRVPALQQKHGNSFDAWDRQSHFLEGMVNGVLADGGLLLKAIHAKSAKLRGALDDAKRKLADIEARIDADTARVAQARSELKQLADSGWNAFAKRDAAALETLKKKGAQVAIRELADAVAAGKSALTDFKALLGGKNALSAFAEKKLLDGAKLLQGRLEQMDKLLFECESLKARLRDLALVPVDLERAVAQLELDRSAKADLQKALQGDESQMTRGLEALAKKLKARLGGKEMFARLRKAQLV